MQFTEHLSILQGAISPVILISGVGLLILSMTNRFGRVIDRARSLSDTLHRTQAIDEQQRLKGQLHILMRRARLLRFSIGAATVSALAAAILVMSLFLTAVLHAEAVYISAGLLIVCLAALIVALMAFLRDINLSLAALKLEVRL